VRRTLYAIAAPITVGIIKLLWSTYRHTVTGDDPVRELVDQDQPLILTFWHENLFVMTWYLVRLGGLGARVTYLVSPSQDGEFAVRMLAVVGGRAVRGSATRSGVRAMYGLYRAIARENASPVVVPDGPQGPRRHAKPGAVMLGKLSGARILPMACAARRGWRLPTWDRLLLPIPFTRVAVVLGEARSVPTEMSSEELERERAALEVRLRELEDEAKRLARGHVPTGDQ
jgi:lysophospholipid acyltransferase (LPLAT)-like uncharacterized protein